MDEIKKNKIEDLSRKFGLTDKVKIEVGMIVTYTDPATGIDSWYKVSRCTKGTVNLKGIFSNKVFHKGVSKSKVKEDESGWWKNWVKSEAYQSM